MNIEVNYWKEAYEELKKKCLSFTSVIENAKNQLKNEIKEDT